MAVPEVNVVLRPGTNYRLSRLLPPVWILFLLAVLVWPKDTATEIGGIALSAVLLVASLANLFFWKTDRALIVDLRGVRLTRSGKTVRDIPWQDMTLVHYGMITMYKGNRTAKVPLLHVYGNAGRPIRILETAYTAPRWSILNAATAIAKIAESRSIRVVQKDSYRP